MAFDWEKGKITGETPVQKLERIRGERILRRGEEAKEFLKKPWYKQIFTGRFAEQVPYGVSEMFLRAPTEIGVGGYQAYTQLFPKIRAEKKIVKAPEPIKVPWLKTPTGTLIPEAEKRALRGEPMYKAIGIPAVKTMAAGLETIGLVKGVEKGVKWITKTAKEKHLKSVLDIIEPVRTKKQMEELAKTGRIIKKGKIKPTARDKEIADSLSDVGLSKRNPLKNIANIKRKIVTVAEDVRDFLIKNTKKIYTNVLEKKIDKVEPIEMIKSEKSLNRTFNQVKDWTLRQIRAQGEMTNSDLWKFRSQLDNAFESQFGGKAWDFERLHAAKSAWWEIRRVINNFIAQGTPNAGKVFKDNMRTLSNMYQAIDQIATQVPQWIKATPMWKKLIKIGAGLAIAGGGFGGIYYGLGRYFGGQE